MKYKSAVNIFSCILIITVINISSCVPQACLDEMEAFVNASFYETGTGKPQTPDSITLYGLGSDSGMLYNKATKLDKIKFPLFGGSDTSRFVMKINGIPDTVTFIYSSYSHLVTKECGYTFFHSIQDVFNTRSGIDFILSKGNITTSNEENIRIFY
jgi:hypothetical protein